MAEWESSYGGHFLSNARLLTKEDIEKISPIEDNSRVAKLMREAVEKGYDILYGENPNLSPYDIFPDYDIFSRILDVQKTAAYLYKRPPARIIVRLLSMSHSNGIYAAVKLEEDF